MYGEGLVQAAVIDQLMDGVEDLRRKYLELVYKEVLVRLPGSEDDRCPASVHTRAHCCPFNRTRLTRPRLRTGRRTATPRTPAGATAGRTLST